MRLSAEEIKILKMSLNKISSEAKLYLFGSRISESAKGGDIDLLVVSKRLRPRDLRRLRLDFFKHFGEQKIDIVLDDGSFADPFRKIISQKAILL